MRILGIDPGSRRTGFGVIDMMRSQSRYVTSGIIRVDRLPVPERLRQIFESVQSLLSTYQPDVVAIEKVFVHRDPNAALKLGQARGTIICAAALGGLPVHEYTPTQIKGVIVGRGHADKKQVQFMVRQLLHLSDMPQEDAADALACALCHARFSSFGLSSRAVSFDSKSVSRGGGAAS